MNLSFDNPLFIIPALTGVIFLIVGFIMYKFPPKEINALYGYRTISSMKSKERWVFAQEYSSLEMIKTGAILSLTSVLGLIFKPGGKPGMFLGLGLLILMVVILFIRVERAITNKFENE
jgi:uncharacterized membrane protein